MKSSFLTKTASPDQIYFVKKSGIKIYPVYNFGWFIEVDNNGKIHRFDKKISQKEINESIAKTIIYYYNKLKDIK